jgi:outer membrane protein assembly factor BamB
MRQDDRVTVERSAAPSPPGPDAPSNETAERSHRALARYRTVLRRQRALYFGAVAAIVAAVSVVVALVWSHGEIAHTSLRTAPAAPPSLALAQPSASLTRAWHSADRTAIGTPYWGGTVVTHSTDSVRGRNSRTGAITWSYTRTDRTVCDSIQVQGVTLAIFQVHGNCDQVTALDTDTGRRLWTRTLDENGHPVNGRPAYSINDFTVMITTHSVIYAIDPSSGIDRWVFAQQGCRINGAVLGSRGALISQTCADPDCGNHKFCGSGPQLLLRDASAGQSDDDSDRNPDQIKWNLIGNTTRPVSADAVVSAINTTGTALHLFDADKGTSLGQLTIRALPAALGSRAAVETEDAELIWLDGSCYALAPGSTQPLWNTITISPPTVTATDSSATPALDSARVTVPGSSGIEVIDARSGSIERTYSVPAPPQRSLVYPLGTGFLVAGRSTTVYR